MKATICLTILNEQSNLHRLIDSLFLQTVSPDEVVIVDGGSTDKTVDIIRHLQKKHRRIRFLSEKCLRARGRNLAVEFAKNDIIVFTDGDCIPHKDWIQKITEPFKNREVEIVAGFYKMVGDSSFQNAASVFLGTFPDEFAMDFLPSARSIAFRKKTWEELGGFPEHKTNSSEDSEFNYLAVKAGKNIARVKDALVDWTVPNTLREFSQKIYSYAYWDSRYGEWWHPIKKFSTHNIKVLSVLLRYLFLLFFALLVNGMLSKVVLICALFGVYLFFTFRKCFLKTRTIKVSIWGIILQLVSDYSVIAGFNGGLLNK